MYLNQQGSGFEAVSNKFNHSIVPLKRCVCIILKDQHFKSWHVFGAPYKKIDDFSARRQRKRKLLRFSRRFRLRYRVSMASAEDASESFRIFCGTAAYDVIFQIPGGKCPSCPPPCGRPRVPPQLLATLHWFLWPIMAGADPEMGQEAELCSIFT